MLHTIVRKQILNCDLRTAWDFMRSPSNLAKITPDFMGFQILTDLESLKEMYPGQIVEYHVTPLAGFKMHWVTEITHVQDLHYFVDEQRFGPYAFWHHKHFLKEVPNGVEMLDIVHYKAPFGVLGKIANALFIKKTLKKIFDHRHQVLEQLFNQPKK
jgi:ligand-binding SRPBCC domain-containing protein